MDKWEYKAIKGRNYRPDDEVIKELNELGKEGWEAFMGSLLEGFMLSVYLKRKINK